MTFTKAPWLAVVAAVSTAALVGCSSTASDTTAVNDDSDYQSAQLPTESAKDKASERPNPALAAFPVDATVHFAFDSAKLTGEANQALRQLVQEAKQYDDIKLHAKIDGFADATGPDEYNQNLSVRRAKQVANYLESQAVPVTAWSVDGHGESNPVADNDSNSGREQNRRVVVTFSVQQIDESLSKR